METLQNEVEFAHSPAKKMQFKKHAERELIDIQQEVEQAHALDNEIDPVPDSAYHDAYSLLEILFYNNVPMPDIGWLMDGGIGFEWRSQDSKGIGTMSIYGDNQVVYGSSLGNGRKVKGTCELTHLGKLVCFFPTLIVLCSQ